MCLLSRKLDNFLYKEAQCGLVIVLFIIVMLSLPCAIFIIAFFTNVPTEEANSYTKFSAIFTAIGAIATIINAIVVIYLMVKLDRKTTRINLIPLLSDMKRKMIDIELIVETEITYFKNREYDTSEQLSWDRHLHKHQGFDLNGYEYLYEQEIANLGKIIKQIEELYKLILGFRKKLEGGDIFQYEDKLRIIEKLDEVLVLRKPSAEYKKGFIQADPSLDDDNDYKVGKAEKNASCAVKEAIALFKSKSSIS